MNKILLGTADKTEQLLQYATGEFLLIADEFKPFRANKLFDPRKHRFNPCPMTVRDAREFALALYGEQPLMTYRNGKRALARMLPQAQWLDQLPKVDHPGYEDAKDTVADLLLSPVLKRIFTGKPNFTFDGSIVARLNRAELGEQDAYLLGQLLIRQFKGQIIVLDAGFYLSDSHVSLLRENRLMCSVNYLDELPPKLRANVLFIKDKELSGVLYEDAVELAKMEGLRPDFNHEDNPYNRFIDEAME